MFDFFSIDNFNLRGKVVGIRVDINSPIINGKVVLNERIVAHSNTIRDLSEKGAKVVILAHQGRKGKDDCISLSAHSKLLSKQIKKPVMFIPEIFSTKVVSKVHKLKNGEILLLENLRFLDDENEPYSRNNKIVMLEDLFDYYVFDAFSVAHREQTSVVSFTSMPNLAGRVMESELLNLGKLVGTNRPHVYLFGGAKPDDLVELMESSIQKDDVDLILLTGVIGELALHLTGNNIGKKYDFMKENGFLNSESKLKSLLDKHRSKFVLPFDVAVDKSGKRVEVLVKDFKKNSTLLNESFIQDIGKLTVSRYSEILKTAGAIYVKGPAGNFDLSDKFAYGTKSLMKAATDSTAFSFMGGGHTVTAAKMYGVLDKFSYISLAGGALVHFLSGKELPGIKTLQDSYEIFSKEKEDFIVVGSNTVDTSVRLPEKLASVKLGDKIRINENFSTSFGGGGITVSFVMKKLGAKIAYLGKISEENSESLKSYLSDNSIELIDSSLTKTPCAKSILVDTEDDDRVIFTYRGQNSELDIKDFDFKKISARNFYYNSIGDKSFQTLIELSKKVKDVSSKCSKYERKHLVFYNPSSYLIKSEKNMLKLVKYVDILILNYEEAQMLIKKNYSISNCLKEIKKHVKEVVVITDGAKGAYAYDGKKEFYQKAFSFGKKVYATGAGDSFGGSFAYFYSRGYGITNSLKFAAVNAASVISRPGAQNGLLTFEEIRVKCKELNI